MSDPTKSPPRSSLSPSQPLGTIVDMSSAPPPSPRRVHATTAHLPVLESAPPSLNFDPVELRSALLPPPPPPLRAMPQSHQKLTFKLPPQQSNVFPQATIAPLPPPPVMSTSRNDDKSNAATSPTALPATMTTPSEPLTAERQEETVISRTPQEPYRLPYTTFLPKSLQLVAKRQTHIPILVIATEAANKIAWKNQLRLCDLLEGLIQSVVGASASTSALLAPFRSVGRSIPLTWQDINVTFQEPDEIAVPIPDDDAAKLLQEHATVLPSDGNLENEINLLEDKVDNLLQDETNLREVYPMDYFQVRQGQLEQVTKDAFALTSPLSIPWLWRYRQALDAVTSGLEHDMFQCPALVLLVCTTQEYSNPIETFRELGSSQWLPRPFHNGLFDPSSVRQEVLVLHDNVEGPKDWVESTLINTLQSTFGPAAAVLRVNSIAPETAARLAIEETSDLWGGSGTKGSCLSVSDRVAIRKYLANLVASCVLPALEKRIADLNVIVSDRKKGVRNVLKNFWRTGKSKEEEEVSMVPGAVRYRFDCIESQARLLADTLFLMKDFEAALGIYRLIKDDFKHDKANIHYGSVQEMMALSMYLVDQYGRTREIFDKVENALLSYTRAADDERDVNQWGEKPSKAVASPRGTKLATRLCLVLASTRNICEGRYLEVADLLASASSNETALGAAVLLEQSAAYYFRADMYRKYAFHSLMAGHMFRAAEQHHHAFRCFASALYIYRDGRWEELHNHLQSALAAQLYTMDRMAISLQLYSRLVGAAEGSRVSVKSQQKFLTHLFEICNDHPKKALVGADRMAAPPRLPAAERDAFRKQRLDRIVQVVRHTKSASRVLELPSIGLPYVDDSTVTILAEEAAHHRQETIPSFGEAGVGSEDVWEELMLVATSELSAVKVLNPQNDEVTSRALAKIKENDIRRVIAQIDKEKAGKLLADRARRSTNYKEKPPTRAQMEPFAVEFALSNPLGIPIDITDLQLIAKVLEADGNRLCTNQDCISVTPFVSYSEKRTWRFDSSNEHFEAAHFCCVSQGDSSREKISWKSAEEVEPFFVVTKLNFTLDPESRKTVAVGICPLVRGNLEVIGVRYRLQDAVWASHLFDIRGPLLQNTRSNRANRVRGESVLLKAHIGPEMPCLTAELVCTSSENAGPALQGQIRKWVLRIANQGTASAGNLTLKTNVPWVNVTEDRDNPRKEEPVSRCIGPTGTLMSLPIDGPELRKPGQIDPGEAVEVPIEIRTSGAGKQDFYMLFRYELVGDKADDRPRIRWLKKMFKVPVFPSVNLSASVAPSFSVQGEHILSIQVTNYRSDRPDDLEIYLKGVGIASKKYRLEPLQIFPGDQLSVATLELGWQERTTLHFRVVPEESDSSPQTLYSFIELSHQDSALRSFSDLSFMCLERAHDHFDDTLRSHRKALARAVAIHDAGRQHPRSIAQIRRANTSALFDDDEGELRGFGGDEKPHPTSIEKLCLVPDDIHVTLFWRNKESSIEGEHHIRALRLQPLESTKSCPITVTAQHPVRAKHDFGNGPATIPFEVILRNRLIGTQVGFEFKMERSAGFDFTGPERFKAKLGGGQEMRVPLYTNIHSAGVYNLQNVRLTVDRGETVSYIFPLQWMVVVDSI